MTKLLNFIDIPKYVYLYTFFKNNNLPSDIFVYIVDIAIPFEKYVIDEIYKINITNKEGIFFCNNIFDKMTWSKYFQLVNGIFDIEDIYYCIVDDGDEYIIYEKKHDIPYLDGIKYVDKKDIYPMRNPRKYFISTHQHIKKLKQ